MASNTSEAETIAILNAVSAQINRYLSLGILLFGTIGNLLNCLALSQRTLRCNPCASFFLVSSLSSLLTLLAGLTVRLLSGWSADLTETVDWLCKLRAFVLFAFRTAASWLITLATIDRWLSSSASAALRQLSSLKNAHRGMLVTVCLAMLAYAQFFYCFEANLVGTPLRCYGKTPLCRLIYDFQFICLTVFIPTILMLSFGLLTIVNVRQSAARRVRPETGLIGEQTNQTTTPKARRSKKTDRRLLFMLFIQVILLTLFSLPQAIHSLYGNIVRGQTRSPLSNTINNFILNIFFLLTYVTNGMPFYIYTLTGGSVFRKALLDAAREFLRKIR